MNLPSGLGTSTPLAFWVVLFTSVVIGFAIRRWVLSEPRGEE